MKRLSQPARASRREVLPRVLIREEIDCCKGVERIRRTDVVAVTLPLATNPSARGRSRRCDEPAHNFFACGKSLCSGAAETRQGRAQDLQNSLDTVGSVLRSSIPTSRKSRDGHRIRSLNWQQCHKAGLVSKLLTASLPAYVWRILGRLPLPFSNVVWKSSMACLLAFAKDGPLLGSIPFKA